jgi:hypothetical protein
MHDPRRSSQKQGAKGTVFMELTFRRLVAHNAGMVLAMSGLQVLIVFVLPSIQSAGYKPSSFATEIGMSPVSKASSGH